MKSDLTSIKERIEKASEWRSIPDWPYEASDTGVIRSTRSGKALQPAITHNGYEKVTFQVDKTRKDVRVHRAIAEAWYGAIPPGMQINHKDGIKTNNSPSNLEIVTGSENMRHAAQAGLAAIGDRNGTRVKPDTVRRGSLSHKSKLTEADVIAIRGAVADGASQRGLAKKYGVHFSLISQIVLRKTWTHI